MRQFTIDGESVLNCVDCKFAYLYQAFNEGSCEKCVFGGMKIFDQNRHKLTPSCPMWSQSVEIAE